MSDNSKLLLKNGSGEYTEIIFVGQIGFNLNPVEVTTLDIDYEWNQVVFGDMKKSKM